MFEIKPISKWMSFLLNHRYKELAYQLLVIWSTKHSHPCIAENKNNADVCVYIYIYMLLFFCFCYPEFTYGLSERGLKMGWRWLRLHAHSGHGTVLLWTHSTFLSRSARVEMFPGLYHFLDACAILVVKPLTYTLHATHASHVAFLLVSLVSVEAPASCWL